ncbi:MAG: hypothetical protein MZV70_42350 [Desulfobacterales bacterium]|nr:hypothetical protein [Desulfobacterales bacterium]
MKERTISYMGNDAIVRGALEGKGVKGVRRQDTPGPRPRRSSNSSRASRSRRSLYVEWAANEKIATEIAAAASFRCWSLVSQLPG